MRLIPNETGGAGSYDWNLGDGGTSTSKVEFQHKFPPVGLFQVCLTRNNNECVQTNCQDVMINAAGLDNLNRSLVVYPNPGNGQFNVRVDGVSGTGKVLVMNLLGEVIYSQDNVNLSNGHNVNLTEQAAGVYMVKVVTGENEYTQKITIVK
jgi:PKD repeat protein